MVGSGERGESFPYFGQIRHEFEGQPATHSLSDEARTMRKNAVLLGEYIPEAASIRDLDDVAEALGRIHDYLRAAGIPDAFNYVYWRLSESLARSKDDFNRPGDVDHTSPRFLDYELEPLRNYAAFHEGDEGALGRISATKDRTLLDRRLAGLPDGLQFLIGMVDHIRSRDLMESVHHSGANQSPAYYQDYTELVGKKIVEVTEAEADQLMPGHPALKRALVPITASLIAVLRQSAWQGSQELVRATPEEAVALLEQADKVAVMYQEMIFRMGRLAFQGASLTEGIKLFEGAGVEASLKMQTWLSTNLARTAITGIAKIERRVSNGVIGAVEAGMRMRKPSGVGYRNAA